MGEGISFNMGQIFALESALKLRLVTGNFEVIYALYEGGATPSRELARRTKVSMANFQVILKRLREEGIVVIEQDASDGRKRRYALALRVWNVLDLAFARVGDHRQHDGRRSEIHHKDRFVDFA